VFRLPDDFLVQKLPAVRSQQLDDARTVSEIVPESSGVK
jgi:hypothetical protein